MGDDALRRAYLEEIRGAKLLRSLRYGIGVVLALYVAFLGADLVAHRGSLVPLVGVRAAASTLLVGLFFAAGRLLSPRAATAAGCLVTGAGLVAIISVAGGVQGGYAPGLMLLFLGMPVLLPLTPGFAAWIVGVLMALLLGAPFALGQSFTWSEYFLYACFPGAAAIECIASCVALDRMRFNDFAQRAQLEEARDELKELDRAKSRFTANIHHELRTPLTLMLAPLEALRSGELASATPAVDRTLRTMQTNGERLLKLINDLLDIARAESRELCVRRVRLEPGAHVRQAVGGARGLAEHKGLALGLDIAPGLGPLYADPEALDKVLVNLLGNALKFTQAGRVDVELRPASPEDLGTRGEAPGGRAGGVHLVVRDTGIGMPADQLERIFDRFAQVEAAASRTHPGTGIGLSLVKELVELHGGRVWAESPGPGQGSALHVVLPEGEPDAEPEAEAPPRLEPRQGGGLRAGATPGRTPASGASEALEVYAQGAGAGGLASSEPEAGPGPPRVPGLEAPPEPAHAELPAHPPGTPEVVVADDNAEIRHLLAQLVGREYRVRCARHGAEALAMVRERLPALVVTDVLMPQMTGTELCRALKGDPVTRGVPVMLLTSRAEHAMQIEGLELGAEDYVTKPFHPRELMARVRALVRLRTLQQELAEKNERLAESNAGLARALTELKEAEVQLVQAERLAAVGELSAGVAHEVNNPLNFARHALATLRDLVDEVQGYAERLAALDPRDPAQLEAVVREKQALGLERARGELGELTSILGEGLERTARLVAELRDFAASRPREPVPVDVAAGIQATLRLMAHRLREAGAELETELPEDLPRVLGDPAALNQVFLNLLKNAAEALEGQGGGALHVSAHAAQGKLCVRVRDAGPGVDAETRERLFEPFFSTKPAGRGTGLGLSICRRIVGEHGGSIELDSTPGAGTCFEVRLPCYREA